MNPETAMTLDEAVNEVLGLLTGLDLTYHPELDRWRVVVRCLNRALRANALEQEWGYYSSVETVGVAVAGDDCVVLPDTMRPRIINDDSIRLVNAEGIVVEWAYILPRDALHKYRFRDGLWAAVTRDHVNFSRPFTQLEDGLEIQIPVMREPYMFSIPEPVRDANTPQPTVPQPTLDEYVDFDYPDLIVARAAYYYAQSDPVMQPRVQTLEAEYKDLMYQIMERDERNTDSPYENEFRVPIVSGLLQTASPRPSYHHPHAD